MVQDGDESTGKGSSTLGSEKHGTTSDFRRGKRYRKLLKLLTNARTRAYSRLSYRSKLVLVLLLLVHVAAFVAIIMVSRQQVDYVTDLHEAGRCLDDVHQGCIKLRVLDRFLMGEDTKAPLLYGTNSLTEWVELLGGDVEHVQQRHNGLYLGFNTLRRLKNNDEYQLRDVWEKAKHQVIRLEDVNPPYTIFENASLWDVGNDFVVSAHDTINNYQMHADANRMLPTTRDWFFAWSNGPFAMTEGYVESLSAFMDRTQVNISNKRTALLILLGLEGCLCSLLAIAFIWLTIGKVGRGQLRGGA